MSKPRPVVLVVDDNPSLLDNLGEILEEAGYAVTLADRCESAMERAREGFDVALVDVRLPDGEGTTLSLRLKELSPASEVVLLTGHASVESAAAAVRAGACAFLVKPCATPELLLTLEQAMRHVRVHLEKAELARRAQTAEKLAAVGTMTAGLSHEIRNPLNSAGLQLDVLERRVRRLAGDQSNLLEPLTLVRDEIRRLDHLLEDFLQFARPREFARSPVDLCEVVGRVLDLISSDGRLRKVKFERAIEPVPAVGGDAVRLQQVVMNLVLNAMEALPDGGRVRVSLRKVDREVELAIEDDGPGVPESIRERVFEPFFTTKASGTGLGLPIVRSIMTHHGGTIVIESGALGGARIRVRLQQVLV